MASKASEMSAPCSVQRRPALPSALRRADPTRPFCVRVLDSTAPEAHQGGHSSIVWGVRSLFSPRQTVPSSASCAARPRPAPPSRRAPPRTNPPGVCPGFRLDRFRSSGEPRISHVRASGEALMFFFFGRVCRTFVPWANSSVGTQSCPTLLGRCAGRPDPTCPWFFRLLDLTGLWQQHGVPLCRIPQTLEVEHLSSAKPGHSTGGSARHGARRTAGRGDAGHNKVPTFRSLWEPTAPLALQRTKNNCSERLFASTNIGNPM